jgi:hypothetical protein
LLETRQFRLQFREFFRLTELGHALRARARVRVNVATRDLTELGHALRARARVRVNVATREQRTQKGGSSAGADSVLSLFSLWGFSFPGCGKRYRNSAAFPPFKRA